MASVIVNGDDFGRSAQVNAGILESHRAGILTSASLMVAEPACGEAVAAARDCPELDVGLHLVACNGKSLLGPRRLRGLVDDRGCFPRSEVWAGLRYAFDPTLRGRLRDEFRAQIERHLESVGHLFHLDGHHNLHLHPVLADLVLPLASEYRVPYVRLVREPIRTTLAIDASSRIRKLRDHVIFSWLSSRAGRQMSSLRLGSNDYTQGFHQTGRLSERYVIEALEQLPPDATTEFYFHPAVERDGQPPLRPSQSVECGILTSPRVRAALLRSGVRLTTYRELASRSPDALRGGD
jgi:chitin disaccharide deacetylase